MTSLLKWRLLFLVSGAMALAQGELEGPGRAETPPMAGAAGAGLRLGPPVFQGTNLWLAIEGADPDGLYDLFSTTNLNAGVAWRFEMRSAVPGQMSFLMTEVPRRACFFLLGTMLDADGDGLTDAFEGLVLGTDPQVPDTDQDGVSDYAEFLQGRNPLAGAVPDGQDMVRLRVFTPMP